MCATEDKPLVSDTLLDEWANPDFDAQRGEFDAETRAMLAVALPEICRELLTRRQCETARAAHLQARRREFLQSRTRRRVA